MTIPAVRCTVDFLPDDNQYDAIIALRHKDGSWTNYHEQRFVDLPTAWQWIAEIYPLMIEEWRAQSVAPIISTEKATVAEQEPFRPLIFTANQPWWEIKPVLMARMQQVQASKGSRKRDTKKSRPSQP